MKLRVKNNQKLKKNRELFMYFNTNKILLIQFKLIYFYN